MLQLSPALESLRLQRTHRFAVLWRITRVDGHVLRFTSHDRPITYAGFSWTPAGGFSASALQRQDGFKDRNWEATGIISSDAITFDDLRAGKYRQAKVEAIKIDWRYPWADPFEISTFWIVNTQFTGVLWEAQIEGLTHKLKMSIGRIFARTCDVHAFGDQRCGLNEADFTFSGSVTAINVARRDFQTTVSQTTNYFKRGYLKWTSGLNEGLTMEINKSFGTAGRIVLWLSMPYDVAIGDTFNAVVGCDRLYKTCLTKFNNIVNFRGFPWVPGTDAILRTPDAKT
jgi:uncharacterized phage protein (TIGR02218 family)